MSSIATATVTPEKRVDSGSSGRAASGFYGATQNGSQPVRGLREVTSGYAQKTVGESAGTGSSNNGLNAALAQIVQSVTNRNKATGGSKIITVDLAEGESVQEFSTRLRMLLMFMNRDEGSVSATVSPSFQNDTYPAMLALVKTFESSGTSGDWRPDGPRAIRMGKARHLFVSVDMPVADRSASPDTLIEIVAAHRISSEWYDLRVSPRAPSTGMTTVLFGVPAASGGGGADSLHASSVFTNSVFKRERAKNLSGRPAGIHFSRLSSMANWSATTAV
jgi:hypothetical protein